MTLAKSVGGLGFSPRPKTVHLLVCEARSVLFFLEDAYLNWVFFFKKRKKYKAYKS